MSTKSTLAFAIAFAILVAGVIALGLPLVAVGLATGMVLLHVGLLAVTWGTTNAEASGRSNWERPAVVWAVPVGWVGIVVAAVLVAHHVHPHSGAHVPFWRSLLDSPTDGTEWWWRLLGISYASTVGLAYLSSLTDWCYVIPRLRGLGSREELPCRTSTSPHWSTLTRVWMGHRIVAYVGLRISIGVSIVVPVAALQLALPPQAIPAFATVVAALVVYFLNRHSSVATLTSNPSLNVGDRIVLAEEFGTGITERPSYYVLDVAIEGVGLVELTPNGTPVHSVPAADKRIKDRTLDLKDINRLLRGRHPFMGCAAECCGANKYCPKAPGTAVFVADPPEPAGNRS